ncbi:helix-turn-helix transcriptional regulator [Ectopseudomonas guguanensis]|uniref:LuxR family transcriptional regulator, maltose regulon positive regulatory protein n=1 Tax=Ectopseudomonas guguanensis TaxID=1198456 RepID=A0A1H0XE94_9GAMM|nr:LuxR C-terminal-related transcriptional regulator [Pseudomonas guguanensis]SDQ01149.1 LuxR family transcriptional regulator, maltose regulon positive regulatory protein [Pseudomonas guguanensis]
MTSQNPACQTAAPLLRTKLYPAHAEGAPLLQRSALLERLLEAREQRLIVLSAPAGFGKSTVLSQLRSRLQGQGARVAWLSCDESDGEPARLLQYLVAAIGAVCPGFGSSATALLQGEVSWPLEAVIDAFLDDLRGLSDDLYLMLDDFHRVHHPSLGQCSRYLIERLPRQVRLVVSTRHQPRFLDEQPALGAWAFWLKAEDLRLTRAETAAYFRDIKCIVLEESELDQLYARTEGWITALHLAALALPRQRDRAAFLAGLSGAERNIADYLAEDVVASLPEALQLFLDQTSVLDEFNAELCNALTGRQDGRDMLRRLQGEQLFVIALDEQGEWFRYHHLFAEFLQGRLARRGDPAHLLHAAARWCESHDLADKSIKYALRARDYAFAAELLERQGARLIAGNRVYGILAILKDIPPLVITEQPVFQIFYAWQLAFEQKFAESEALIEEVSTRLTQGRGKGMHFGLIELLAAAQVLKALVLLYQDKLEACLKVAGHWLSLVPQNQPVFRASLACVQAAAFALLGEFGEAAKAIAVARENLRQCESEYLHVMASLIEALICKEYGELERGRALAESARARVEQVFGRRSRVGGPLGLAYADLLYEQDRHGAILAELPLATTWRDVATPVELISRGKLVMARARFFAGAAEQGLEELDEWLAGLQGPGYERVFAIAMGCKVQFLLWLRRPNEAQRIYLQLERHLAALPIERYGDAHTALALSEARLALSERRVEKAQASLEACLAKQGAEHQRDRRLRLSLLLSVAYWRKGNSEKAFALLRTTLEEAWQCGYRRLFQDDALWLLPLWDAWKGAEPKRAAAWQGVAETLREQCRRLAIDPDSFDENQDVSHREREILRLVAAGLSNRDIAQAVHLSEATIKWHLHNLFSKLGVRSRTQAVLKGKSLGLLSEA